MLNIKLKLENQHHGELAEFRPTHHRRPATRQRRQPGPAPASPPPNSDRAKTTAILVFPPLSMAATAAQLAGGVAGDGDQPQQPPDVVRPPHTPPIAATTSPPSSSSAVQRPKPKNNPHLESQPKSQETTRNRVDLNERRMKSSLPCSDRAPRRRIRESRPISSLPSSFVFRSSPLAVVAAARQPSTTSFAGVARARRRP
ncbi:hypothetical protein Dimus_037809 [Dionaea muscipula]